MSKGKVSYNHGDGIIEIIIRDETGSKLDHFKANLKDTRRQSNIARKLTEKYGIIFEEIKEKKEGFFDY